MTRLPTTATAKRLGWESSWTSRGQVWRQSGSVRAATHWRTHGTSMAAPAARAMTATAVMTVVDGIWSTVGSSNFDIRSFLHNSEINVIVLGDPFGRTMESAFQEDIRNSREIKLEEWEQRPTSERIKEWSARRLVYYL